MANIRFLYQFTERGAAITAKSRVATLPAADVADDFVGKVWRARGAEREWLKFDLGSAKPVTEVALFGHNLTGGASITLEANAADDWSSPAFSRALTWHAGRIVAFLDRTYRWWRLVFADAANPRGYIEVGRVCLGAYVEPAVNIHERWTRRWVDPSDLVEEFGAQGYANRKAQYRLLDVRFMDVDRAQQDQLSAMFEDAGMVRPVVVSVDPADQPSTDSLYARFAAPLTIETTHLGRANAALRFKELVS